MPSVLKRWVSQNRRRYNSDGFDLDLTYILPNLIAMGFPAGNYERFYRNNIDDVCRFFEMKHPGHYRIYNLCSERTYDFSRFQFNVVVFPFEDHQPPPIELIKACCDDIDAWIKAHPENVAAVHCKAGKGRTGLIICAYLLHAGLVSTPIEALSLYGRMRTVDCHGVTIPSQQRYINYYSHLLKSGLRYQPLRLQLCGIQFLHDAALEEYPCSGLVFTVVHDKAPLWTSEVIPVHSQVAENPTAHVVPSLNVSADVLVECYGQLHAAFALASLFGRREKLFHFWFNTFFIEGELDNSVVPGNEIAWTVTVDRLDMEAKDRALRQFPPDFRIRLWFHRPLL
ncbi:hypothetical protein RvY_00755 [Ramazzottius varieornatus]|uniref:Phosphatidylinositol 3,4,5-trisphosphate 3-phosphatase and dual-specificity protein phosphatase PTEN n=1 Tax=Ramazzottius varieornatus TaxID=947166 RepID=A0A1D1UP87_RAMVA|nr:hypothetical protein RvY_00755 [Ramazzottius varieornatus]